MTPTCTVRILSNSQSIYRRGMVLVEMLMAIAIVAMMTAVAMLSFSSVFGDSYFQRRATRLVEAFQAAYNTAQQSDRRYAVVLYFNEKAWVLRQFNRLDFEGIPEEEAIIKTGSFDEQFKLDYVYYDDGDDTRDPAAGQQVTEARFYAGHGGWQCGGKVVLRDVDDNPWSIVIYRAGKPAELLKGDVAIFVPVESAQMPF